MTRRAPLLPLAAGFAIGIWVRPPGAGLALVALLLPLALSPPLAPAAFVAAGALAGGLTATPSLPPHPQGGLGTRLPSPPAGERGTTFIDPIAGEGDERLQGRVASVPERLEGRVRFLLQDTSGRLLLATAPPPTWPLAWGDEILLTARLFAPEGPRNPGGRDTAALLAARGVSAQAHARLAPVRLSSPSPLAWLEAGRSRFAAAADASLPPREAALVRAIGAGDRSALDPATNESFARSGLAHILSVSGLHLAVVALGTWRVLRGLLLRWEAVAVRSDPRRLAAALALPVTAAYALATGADVPVVRSALAAGLGFGGALLDREPTALSSLSLALLAVLAAEPGALLDISFQLSFASVAGLALLTRPLREALPWRPPPTRLGRLGEAALSAVAAGAAATLATAPLVAFHFRRVSVLSVAANLLGIPVGSALTVAAALAALAAAALPVAALPFLWLCRPLAWLLLAVNDLFAAPAAAVIGLASPGPAGVAASTLGLWGAVAFRGWRRAAAAVLAVGGLALPGPVREAAAARRGLLEVTFLSVGQGDSALLRLPDGAAVLVDGGGDPRGHYDPGGRDVLPFLRDAGVRRLWLAVLSHPHPDHVLGLGSVAASLPVERFLSSGRSGEGAAVAAALARLPAPLSLAPGQALERAGVRLRVLGPPPGTADWAENDASLVLRVEHGDVAFFLPGDVEAQGEEALLASGLPLAADVVKVPHHAARTSSGPALVAATHPRFAVISLARRNVFGFPVPEVVERWRGAGAEVLRTDGGAVRFLSDGKRVWRVPAEGAIDALALWRERP